MVAKFYRSFFTKKLSENMCALKVPLKNKKSCKAWIYQVPKIIRKMKKKKKQNKWQEMARNFKILEDI